MSEMSLTVKNNLLDFLTLANTLSHFALEVDEVLSPLLLQRQTRVSQPLISQVWSGLATDRRVHIGRWLVVGVGQHRDHWDQDGLDRMHWKPTFGGFLVAVLVVTRLVKNRYTDVTILVDCGTKSENSVLAVTGHTVRVPYFGDELHFGRTQGIVFREAEVGLKETALTGRTKVSHRSLSAHFLPITYYSVSGGPMISTSHR